jgi:hypothetical protein
MFISWPRFPDINGHIVVVFRGHGFFVSASDFRGCEQHDPFDDISVYILVLLSVFVFQVCEATGHCARRFSQSGEVEDAHRRPPVRCGLAFPCLFNAAMGFPLPGFGSKRIRRRSPVSMPPRRSCFACCGCRRCAGRILFQCHHSVPASSTASRTQTPGR